MFINGTVMCAKCGKPVDKMSNVQNPFTGSVTFTVYCHGEREETTLTLQEIQNAISIDSMYAFEGKK